MGWDAEAGAGQAARRRPSPDGQLTMEPGRLLEAGKTEGSFKREHVSVGHGRLSVGFGSGQAWVLDGPCDGRGRGRAGLSSGGGRGGGEGGGWRVREGDREGGRRDGPGADSRGAKRTGGRGRWRWDWRGRRSRGDEQAEVG